MEQLSEQATAWLDPAVDFVVETGLQQLTLRPLGARLGTSDRMLLYHFGTKEQLVRRVIIRASERLADSILRSLDPPPRRPVDVLLTFWRILTSDDTAPYVRLYLELVVAGLRDPDAYGEAVRQIATAWLALADHLLGATGARLPRTAGLDTLAALDGLIVARASLGPEVDAEAALRRLAKSWASGPRTSKGSSPA